jgi:hypothetical protein
MRLNEGGLWMDWISEWFHRPTLIQGKEIEKQDSKCRTPLPLDDDCDAASFLEGGAWLCSGDARGDYDISKIGNALFISHFMMGGLVSGHNKSPKHFAIQPCRLHGM